jgi:hypothetical protein
MQVQVVLVEHHQDQEERLHYSEHLPLAVLFVAQEVEQAVFILKVVVSAVAVERVIAVLTMVVVTEDKVVIL